MKIICIILLELVCVMCYRSSITHRSYDILRRLHDMYQDRDAYQYKQFYWLQHSTLAAVPSNKQA